MDPYWKLQPVAYKVNMEWKLELRSLNKDHSHSWVRISHGLNKLVTDLIDKEYDDNEQETSDNEDGSILRLQAESKAKAKPRSPSTTCSSSRTVNILERKWIDIESGAQFESRLPSGKKTECSSSSLSQLSREEDGAIVNSGD